MRSKLYMSSRMHPFQKRAVNINSKRNNTISRQINFVNMSQNHPIRKIPIRDYKRFTSHDIDKEFRNIIWISFCRQ